MLNRDLRCPMVVLLVAAITARGGSTAQEHLDKAHNYLTDGDTKAAVIEFKSALQKDPSLAEARLALGETYLELGEPDAAVKELDKARDLGVPTDRVLPPLLEAKVDLGRRQEVLGDLEKVELTPRYQAVRGQALLAGGELDPARADFEAAIEADPTSQRAYLGLAQLALSGLTPDLQAASSILNDGVKAVPTSRRLWLVLGEVELNRQDPAAANVAFEKAAALPGNDFGPQLGLARVRLLENKPKDAKTIVDGVLARAPKHPLAQHLNGVIALAQNDLDAAENAFLAALAVIPEYPPSLLALANVKHLQGSTKQAESYLRRYVAQDPDNPAPRKALAGLLLQSGDGSGEMAALDPVRDRLTNGDVSGVTRVLRIASGSIGRRRRTLAAAATAAPETPAIKTQLALSRAAAGDSEGRLPNSGGRSDLEGGRDADRHAACSGESAQRGR